MKEKQLFKPAFFLVFLFTLLPLAAADLRQEPIDVFLILDISAIKNNQQEAIDWVCDTIIDKMVQEGDRLSIWSASGGTSLVFNETISAQQRELAKRQVRGLQSSGNGGSFYTALREAERRISALPAQRMAYTLLVSGVGLNPDSMSSPGQENTPSGVTNLLRYAKTENFAGWKAMLIGIGINDRVRGAAASYINNTK